MDITEQVQKWVEKKVEKVINKDLKEKIVEENSEIDVEAYVNYLFEKYVEDGEDESFKEILINNNSCYNLLYSDSENSSEERNSINDSLELEANEYQTYSAEEIIENLKIDSEEVQKKYLKVLESCAEELVNQNSWKNITEILQKILNKTENKEIHNLTLKIFQKPLRCPKKPQIVSKGFISITEVLNKQIDKFNLERSSSFEEIYDIKEEKWLLGKKFNSSKDKKTCSPEIMIKLMWLLIDCQQQIPAKWVGFNEARFREIIFSFIRLLSSTTSESKSLSGLEILSVLNPSAGWCRYWCHTAVGRNLLSSALRKYKSFFVQIVDNILKHINTKKDNRLSVGARASTEKQSPVDVTSEESVPNKNLQTETKEKESNPPTSEESNSLENVKPKSTEKSSEWILEKIPREIVTEAVFFHSISFVSCLIQFRNGRALFPLQTVSMKRLLSVQDLSLSMIDYLENIEWNSEGIPFTSTYEIKVKEMLDILKTVKTHVTSSRMSTDRQKLK